LSLQRSGYTGGIIPPVARAHPVGVVDFRCSTPVREAKSAADHKQGNTIALGANDDTDRTINLLFFTPPDNRL
jgi:hypothetical protein